MEGKRKKIKLLPEGHASLPLFTLSFLSVSQIQSFHLSLPSINNFFLMPCNLQGVFINISCDPFSLFTSPFFPVQNEERKLKNNNLCKCLSGIFHKDAPDHSLIVELQDLGAEVITLTPYGEPVNLVLLYGHKRAFNLPGPGH